MSLHDRVSLVLGFEVIQSAVEDAGRNAAFNDLPRCTFFCGKAEDTLAPAIADAVRKQGRRRIPNSVCTFVEHMAR